MRLYWECLRLAKPTLSKKSLNEVAREWTASVPVPEHLHNQLSTDTAGTLIADVEITWVVA